MTRIAIHGAAGRMGQRLVALAHEDSSLSVVAATDAPDHPRLGEDVGQMAGVGPINLPLADSPHGNIEVMIDFSLPAGTRAALNWCDQYRWPLIIGTTGLNPDDHRAIDDVARIVPVLQASNFSLVVNVLHELIAKAAPMLGDDYDIEILEAHHRDKRDAPSGTAMGLAQTICEVTDRDFDKDVIFTRHGADVLRQKKQITMQVLRIGDHPGEHTVYFAAPGERLELKHVSTSRDSYVHGALGAAKWLAGKPAGRYTMRDVLGL